MRTWIIWLVAVVCLLAGCAGNKTVATSSETNLIYVQLMPKRAVDILVRDLVTINSKPTGLKVLKQMSEETNAWLLEFEATELAASAILKAIKDYPNTLDAYFQPIEVE